MTLEQIKALISEKIAGQGNQVDIAGALPVILGEIVDSLAGITSIIEITSGELSPDTDKTKEEAAAAFGISLDQVDDFFAGKFAMVKRGAQIMKLVSYMHEDGGYSAAKYGSAGNDIYGPTLELNSYSDGYGWYFGEI